MTNNIIKQLIKEEIQRVLLEAVSLSSAFDKLKKVMGKKFKGINYTLQQNNQEPLDENEWNRQISILYKMLENIDIDSLKSSPDGTEEQTRGETERSTSVIWMAKQIQQSSVQDFSWYYQNFDKFVESIRRQLEKYFGYRDLMSEKDLSALTFETLGEVTKEADDAIMLFRRERLTDVHGEVEVFSENHEGWFIAALHTKNAACSYGLETEWCTANPEENHFETYYRPFSPLFYFKNLETDELFQISYGNDKEEPQFKDSDDDDLPKEQQILLHNLLLQLGVDKKYYIIFLYEHIGYFPWTKEFLLKTKKTIDTKGMVAFFWEAAQDDNYEIRRGIARNPKTPVKILTYLSNDTNKIVLRSLARNPNLPIELMYEFVNYEIVAVKQGLASNIATPSDILLKLYKDELHPRILMNLAKNPNVPEEILENLARMPIVAKYIAQNPNLSHNLMRYLAKVGDTSLKIQLLYHQQLPLDILEIFSEDEDELVRRATLSEQNVSEYILSKLSNDESINIRAKVARTTMQPDLLEKLSQDNNLDVKTWVASNLHTPIAVLLKLLKEDDLKEYILDNPIYQNYYN